MRTVLLYVVFISGFAFAKAQTTPQTIVETIEVPFGKNYSSAAGVLYFGQVQEDSRCPKDATCVWAGQVKVLLRVNRGNTGVKSEVFTLNPGQSQEIWSNDQETIALVDVIPHPTTTEKKENAAYSLILRSTKVVK